MITVIVNGRRARAFTDDAITVESVGIPVRFVFSKEWSELDKTAIFECGESRVEVQLTSDRCEVPAMVLTSSGTLRMGGYGAGSGVRMPSTWTEVIVVKGVTEADLVRLVEEEKRKDLMG